MLCLDMARNCFADKLVVMLGDICEAYAHCVDHGLIVYKGTGPNPLCGRYQELAFSRAKDQAEVVKELGHFSAVDESSTEAEVLGSSDHRTVRSYYSYRPCDFDSGMTAILDSHDGGPLLG